MDKDELKDLIDTVYDAVHESKVGPILIQGGQGFGILGKETFLTVLSQLVPKKLVAEHKEPKEPWQE